MTADAAQAALEAWLSPRYRRSTCVTTVAHVRAAKRSWAAREPPPPYTHTSLSRYVAFLGGAAESSLDDFDRWVLSLGLAPAHDRPLASAISSKREATAFNDDDWVRLADVLAQDIRAEARCLEVQLVSGLRVGDALRIRRDALARARQTGEPLVVDTKGGKLRKVPIDGAPDVWERLWKTWVPGTGETMAVWISPQGKYGELGGYGAYQAVRRHLVKLTRALGLQGRTHLHRFRRTVAERALDETKDIHAVQQLLGHAKLSTTEKYVRGFRNEDVSDLLRRIRPGGPR